MVVVNIEITTIISLVGMGIFTLALVLVLPLLGMGIVTLALIYGKLISHSIGIRLRILILVVPLVLVC
jgi:hypothetical protein